MAVRFFKITAQLRRSGSARADPQIGWLAHGVFAGTASLLQRTAADFTCVESPPIWIMNPPVPGRIAGCRCRISNLQT
jgi:hypothetical protein